METIKIGWMNDEEFNTLKEEINRLFPYSKVIRNKQKYAMGGFNIRPTKKQEYEFTEIQVEEIMQWLVDKDLFILSSTAKEHQKAICADGKTISYKLTNLEGFTYIQKIIR